MKRRIGVIIILAVFLSVPLTAHATKVSVGTANLQENTISFANYEGWVTDSSGFDYGTYGWVDIFCVQKNAPTPPADGAEYNFSIFTDEDPSALSTAMYVADNWTTYIVNPDDPVEVASIKRQAQRVIWYILGEPLGTDLRSSTKEDEMYNDWRVNARGGYSSTNWYLAENLDSSISIDGEIIGYQNYYTPKPVPEPATLLMLGSGLIVLAGFGKRRFRKK